MGKTFSTFAIFVLCRIFYVRNFNLVFSFFHSPHHHHCCWSEMNGQMCSKWKFHTKFSYCGQKRCFLVKFLILQSSEKLFCFCFILIFIFIKKEVESGNISYASPRAQNGQSRFSRMLNIVHSEKCRQFNEKFLLANSNFISKEKDFFIRFCCLSLLRFFSGLIWKSRDLFNDCQLLELWTDKRLSRYLLTTHILCFDEDNAKRSQFSLG